MGYGWIKLSGCDKGVHKPTTPGDMQTEGMEVEWITTICDVHNTENLGVTNSDSGSSDSSDSSVAPPTPTGPDDKRVEIVSEGQ